MSDKMYCWECHKPVDVVFPLEAEEVRYPSDMAHPAEWGDPYCDECHSDEVSDYMCSKCGKKGASDDVLAEVNGDLICGKCMMDIAVASHMAAMSQSMALTLINNHGWECEDDANEYVQETIKTLLYGEYIKRESVLLGMVKSLKKEIDEGQEELNRQIEITEGIVRELGRYDLYVKIDWPDSQDYMGGGKDDVILCEDGGILIPMSMVQEENDKDDKEDGDEQ